MKAQRDKIDLEELRDELIVEFKRLGRKYKVDLEPHLRVREESTPEMLIETIDEVLKSPIFRSIDLVDLEVLRNNVVYL